jgi:hypothetical protein
VKQSIKPNGVNADIAPAELDASVWNVGINVIFQNGFAKSGPGWDEYAPGLLFAPLYTIPVFAESAGSYYWIYAGNNGGVGGVGVTDGINHFDITPAGGLGETARGDWTGGTLNGVPFLNNGIDPPMYWDSVPTNPMLELPGWPANTRCGALRAFKYHLVAMNINDGTGEYPDLLLWSDAADPGTIPQDWAPAPDNQAGNFSIATTQGGIVDGGAMRDQFVVYKTDSTTLLQFVGGQFVMSNRKAFVTSGVLARNCFAELYGSHYVLTDGDFILHNGQEVRSLLDGVNRNWLFDQIDSNNYPVAHITLSHADKQVWINFPSSGHLDCDKSLVFDVVGEAFGPIEYDDPITFMQRGIVNTPGADDSYDAAVGSYDTDPDKYNSNQFNPTTDVLTFCRYVDQTLFVHSGYLRDGQPVPILLQMLSKDMGAAQQLKELSAVWALISSGGLQGGLQIRIGTQLQVNDPITWTPSTQIDDLGKVNMTAVGRYISLELTGSQVGDWHLNSIDLDYELGGMW